MKFAVDAEFAIRRHDAIDGSRRLRNAILRSLGHAAPKRARPTLPAFAPPPPMRKRGRPIGSCKPKLINPAIVRIQEEVCAHFGVNLVSLKGATRRKRVLIPRQIAMYIARESTGASYPELGRHFNRDHTTVIHACEQVERRLGDLATIRQIRAIHARITNKPAASAHDAGIILAMEAA